MRFSISNSILKGEVKMREVYIYYLLEAFAAACKGQELKRVYSEFDSNHFLDDLPSWLYYDYELQLQELREKYKNYIELAKSHFNKLEIMYSNRPDVLKTLQAVKRLVEELPNE